MNINSDAPIFSINSYFTYQIYYRFSKFSLFLYDFKQNAMIQRIQTLFLAAAAGLLISMIFTPMVRFTGDPSTTIPFVALAAAKGFTLTTIFQIVCTVLSVVTIFMYKNRIRQIRLCNLNSIILIGYQIILAVYFFQRASKLGDDALFTVPCIFPICAAILTFIAMRYIARDEALVMASTRLRSGRKNGRKKH